MGRERGETREMGTEGGERGDGGERERETEGEERERRRRGGDETGGETK